MAQLTVPDEAIKFIAFQRTEALHFPKTIAFSVLKHVFPRSAYNLGVALEAKLRSGRIKAFYAEDIAREFASIKDHLPAAVTSILDIGCGTAGVDALLFEHYRTTNPDIYLLDKTQTEEAVFYGFKSQGAFYNSLEVAHKMLASNNVPEKNIHLIEATSGNTIDIECRLDLVLSLISWGFHYPVETYLPSVVEIMTDDSILIMDVRKETDGISVLRSQFKRLDIIADEPKYQRVLAAK